ncbi:hypothetical protein [Bacillus cereus]|uniref:Uncharacterized protein n=1 Tax=Bacillus cereus HuA3-9 TaxID=1053205 RepID=R8CML1_BACCE|nr:hypothetical protein [Bacillus cereus]EOO12785.1 hypothetical protein IGA_04799 [Bacillus cereus HuA3-9]
MELTELINKFNVKLSLSEKHIINFDEQYKCDFINLLEVLFKEKIIDNHSKMNSFFSRIQLVNKFDKNTYLQTISEIVFLKYAIEQNYIYKLNQVMNVNKNTDIDLQIIENDITFNFEIKCPKISNGVKSDKLDIEFLERFTSKENLENLKEEFKEDIFLKVIEDSSNVYNGLNYKKLEDNKLKDYLISAQDKFVESNDSSINILVISLNFDKFQSYSNYLFNEWTGFFSINPINGYILNPIEFDKVDTVLFTNLIDNHLNVKENKKAWNLNESINMFYVNPHSKRFANQNSFWKTYNSLLDLIPNNTIDFNKWVKEVQLNYQKKKMDFRIIEPLLLKSYFFRTKP